MEVTMTKEKETPGTVRYKEDGDEPKIGTLYLKKGTVEAESFEDKIKVTVEKA